MFDHLIYDFDGTLSDTYPVIAQILVDMLAKRGDHADYATAYADLKISIGYALKKYSLTGEKRIFHERSIAAALERQEPFPEAAGLLHRAALAGKKNYIYTHSGSEVGEMIQKWGMTADVTFILDKTYGFPSKPDPTALRYLLARFSIDPATALMIGDRDIDIAAGHNAGVAGCLFDPGGYYPDCKAEYRIRNLNELLEIF